MERIIETLRSKPPSLSTSSVNPLIAKSLDMVIATTLIDHIAHVDYTNNYVFLKESSNGFFKKPNDFANQRHVPSPKQLIGDALRERVERIDYEICDPGEEDTFFVADLGEVYRQHLRWKLSLPRVKPFYGRPYDSSPSPSVL